MGLTTIRDYDEYTFYHSVNVCIFSVALGRRLGLGKIQLYDLGLAALFHDVGKARVPVDVLNKQESLSEEEWRAITDHPWLGRAVALPHARRVGPAVPLDDRGLRAPHEARPVTGIPRPSARGSSASSARSWRSPMASTRPPAAALPGRPMIAGRRAPGDARQPAARHGPRGREGVHQPARPLPRGHARRARYLRARDRPCPEPQPRDHVSARW